MGLPTRARPFRLPAAKVVPWLLVLLFWIADCTAIDDKIHYSNTGEYYNLRSLKRTSRGGSSSSSGYRNNDVDVDVDGEGSNALFVLILLVLFGGVPLACWCQCKLMDMAVKEFMQKVDKEEEEVRKDIREFRSWEHEGLRPTDGLYTATYYAGAAYTGCIFCEKRKEIKGTQQVVLKFEEVDVGRGWSVTGHGRDHDGDFTITRGLCSPSGKIYWAEEGNGNRLNKHVLVTGSLQLAIRQGNLRFQVAGDDFSWSLENFSYVGPPIAQGDPFPPLTPPVPRYPNRHRVSPPPRQPPMVTLFPPAWWQSRFAKMRRTPWLAFGWADPNKILRTPLSFPLRKTPLSAKARQVFFCSQTCIS